MEQRDKTTIGSVPEWVNSQFWIECGDLLIVHKDQRRNNAFLNQRKDITKNVVCVGVQLLALRDLWQSQHHTHLLACGL